MQGCLGSADRHLQLLGNFMMFPAFDVVQHQHGARTRRQHFQCALQIHVDRLAATGAGNCRGHVAIGSVDDVLAGCRARTEVHQ